MMETSNLKIVLILTFGFTYASILGYLCKRLYISPILGYLLAGYLIGPYSPGFVADLPTAEQLAEIGVILMMFGVGLGFKIENLLKVKYIATVGAFGQTLVATVISAFLMYQIGWSWQAGILFGLAIGVASTVVLLRVLSDNQLLNTTEGHISVGWLIVEDIITVAILLLLPILATSNEQLSISIIVKTVGLVVINFALLMIFMFTLGRKFVAYSLAKVNITQNHELFTLSVLALTFLIATGSTLLLGTSIALGAFVAGIIIGQTDVWHKALIHSLAMKDAFVVLFFISMGILFNPNVIIEHYLIISSVLLIIIVVKPLTAFLISILFKYPVKTALTIAVALAQIGEFSFILSEEAMKFGLMPDEGFDIIVACALVSISINPFLFKMVTSSK